MHILLIPNKAWWASPT